MHFHIHAVTLVALSLESYAVLLYRLLKGLCVHSALGKTIPFAPQSPWVRLIASYVLTGTQCEQLANKSNYVLIISPEQLFSASLAFARSFLPIINLTPFQNELGGSCWFPLKTWHLFNQTHVQLHCYEKSHPQCSELQLCGFNWIPFLCLLSADDKVSVKNQALTESSLCRLNRHILTPNIFLHDDTSTWCFNSCVGRTGLNNICVALFSFGTKFPYLLPSRNFTLSAAL